MSRFRTFKELEADMQVRKNQGKPRLSDALLMPEALAGLVAVMEYGDKKYSDKKNKGWMKYNPDEILDSMLRHASAIKNGEELDEESGLPHSYHMLFNAAVFIEVIAYCSSEDSYEQSLRVSSTER